jgi:hypothetical protein
MRLFRRAEGGHEQREDVAIRWSGDEALVDIDGKVVTGRVEIFMNGQRDAYVALRELATVRSSRRLRSDQGSTCSRRHRTSAAEDERAKMNDPCLDASLTRARWRLTVLAVPRRRSSSRRSPGDEPR